MPQTTNISSSTTLLKSSPALPISIDWFNPQYWQSKSALAGTGHGRGAVWFINSEFGHFVIRRYRRGGLVAKFNKSRFLYSGIIQTRPWQELDLLEKMQALELPVPTPIAGIVTVKYGFYQAQLITQTIDNAQDLFDIIKQGHAEHVDWNQIGKVIRRFHNEGIYHSDLNCHNIMVDKEGKIWVIDFDKCEQRTPNTDWTQANIDRLKRSIDKESNRITNFYVPEKLWQAFLEGYHG